MLRALDAATGALRWEFDAEFGVDSAPAVAGGLVYFGADHSLFAVDAASGERRWGLELPFRVGSPAVANGIVYVGSVQAFDARRGWRRLQFRAYGRIASSVAVADTTVYAVTTAIGRAMAIDGRARTAPLEHRVRHYTIELWAMAAVAAAQAAVRHAVGAAPGPGQAPSPPRWSRTGPCTWRAGALEACVSGRPRRARAALDLPGPGAPFAPPRRFCAGDTLYLAQCRRRASTPSTPAPARTYITQTLAGAHWGPDPTGSSPRWWTACCTSASHDGRRVRHRVAASGGRASRRHAEYAGAAVAGARRVVDQRVLPLAGEGCRRHVGIVRHRDLVARSET